MDIKSLPALLAAAACPPLGVPAYVLKLRQRKYDELFSYGGPFDYRYRFQDRDVVRVSVDREGFEWPAAAVQAGTVLLELTVSADTVGRWVDPSLVARLSETTTRQYVERGAQGQRYFNLSTLAGTSPAGGRVALQGDRLRFLPQEARLLCMARRPVEGPVLVVAPHPDDAEIAAFGLYCDRESWVVTATAGEVGTHDFGGVFSADAEGHALRGRTRVWESICAPFAGGVPAARAMNLGYFDGSLASMYADRQSAARSTVAPDLELSDHRRHNVSAVLPDAPARATWSALVSDLSTIMKRIGPTVIAAPHPLLERHPDHQYVGLAVMEAALQAGLDSGSLWMYAVHVPGARDGVNLHPVGSRDGAVSLPPFQSEETLFDQLHSEPLTEDVIRRKVLALDVYRDIRPGPALDKPGFKQACYDAAREVYRQLVVYDSSFLRKAVRPNELFYLIPFAEAEAYYERFVKGLAEG